MSPYFAEHSSATVLFAVTVGSWVVVELRQRVRRRADGAKRDRGSYFLLTYCMAAGWVITALSVQIHGAAIGYQPAGFIVGLVLAWVGIVLRGWAFHTLGRYFTFRVETSADQPVIATGPYRVLRHPGYTGVVLIMFGLSLLYGTWVGPVAMATVPTIGLVIRIRVEERALESDLGSTYQAYARTRKRLIPYLW